MNGTAIKPRLEHLLFIDGRFVEAADAARFDCMNPARAELLCTVAAADKEDVDRAVRAARAAFASGSWRDASPAHRKKVLLKLADLVESHAEELAVIETLDTGKPISDARTIDIAGSVQMIAWFAESIDKLYDEIAPTDPHIVAQIRRVPLGVVAAVTPWNFPLLTALTKVVPALAVGNSVVLKPSELSPLSALWLARLASDAGLPNGVLNVVPGFGNTAGKALGLHADVDALLFTGSTATGKRFMQYSGESNLKKVSIESGGKSANIVLDDCIDLDRAAAAAATAIFFNAGQICNAGSRLILQRGIAQAFKEKLIAQIARYRPGDPMLPETTLGSMISPEHANKVRAYVALAQAEGAHVLAQSAPWQAPAGLNAQAWVLPTLIDQVDNRMRIAQEEIFGPVLAIIEADTMEHAIMLANDSPYGLAAAMWTSDMQKAHAAQQQLQAGFVWVNSVRAGHISTPFGGVKQSGFGRDKSLHAFDNVSALKTTWYDCS
jgi:acyl-CoA reductase-like NAD-dependent aldehyde dehydrogenase